MSGLAAEVAFFGILSLFPALLALTAGLGALELLAGADAAAEARHEVVVMLRRVLTDEASGTVDAVEALFEQSSPGVLTFGLLTALWAASRGFAAVIRALNIAYDMDERRSWISVRSSAIGLALGTMLVTIALLAMVVIGPLLGTGREVAELVGFGEIFTTFWTWLRWPAVFVVVTLWAATIFHLAPARRTPWRQDLPGALLTAVLWVALSAGLRAYLVVAAAANQVLGTLGGTLIVLLWFYLLAIGLLLGGELNAILARRPGVTEAPRSP